MKKISIVIITVIAVIQNINAQNYSQEVSMPYIASFIDASEIIVLKGGDDISVGFYKEIGSEEVFGSTADRAKNFINAELEEDGRHWIRVKSVILPQSYNAPGTIVFTVSPNSSSGESWFRINGSQGFASFRQLGNAPLQYNISSQSSYIFEKETVSIYLDGSQPDKTYRLINTSNPSVTLASQKGTWSGLVFTGKFGLGTFRIMCDSYYMNGSVTLSLYPCFVSPYFSSSAYNYALDKDGGTISFSLRDIYKGSGIDVGMMQEIVNKINNGLHSSWNNSGKLKIDNIGSVNSANVFHMIIDYGPNISKDSVVHDTRIKLLNMNTLRFTQTGGGTLLPDDITWSYNSNFTHFDIILTGAQKMVSYKVLKEGKVLAEKIIYNKGTINFQLPIEGGEYIVKAYYGNHVVDVGDPIIIIPQTSSAASGNYIKNKIYSNTDGSYIEDITYYNGLGYAGQIVKKAASNQNTRRDIITPIYYDNMYRESRSYLPYVSTRNTGDMETTPYFNQYRYYQNLYGDGIYAYTETIYDNSPLNRAKATYNVGNVFRPYHNTAHEHRANHETNIMRFEHSLNTYSIIKAGFYTAGTLYVNTIRNEDGTIEAEYKDGLGKTILRRVCDIEDFPELGTHDTYYVYDNFDRLVCVISPEGSAQWENSSLSSLSVDDNIVKHYCYLYKYDGRNRCIAKRLPGTDWEYMVYDKADRLVLAQNGNMRNLSAKAWLLFTYDNVNRMLKQEEVLFTTISACDVLAEYIDSGSLPPILSRKTISQYSYDQTLSGKYYNGLSSLAYSRPSNLTTLPTTPDSRTRGLLTYEKIAVLDGETATTTIKYVERAFYYDYKGRVIQIVGKNHLGGISRYSTEYDFLGNVLKSHESHTRTGVSTPDTKLTVFEYDHRSRLLSETTTLNSGEAAVMKYNYDELGMLISKTCKSQASSGSIQIQVSNIMWAYYDPAYHAKSSLLKDYMIERMAVVYGVDDWERYDYILDDGSINPAYLFAQVGEKECYYFPKIAGIEFDIFPGDILYPFKQYSGMSRTCFSTDEDPPVSGSQYITLDGGPAIKETYTYNIQGWLTEKKSNVFDMQLRYYDPQSGTDASYTGNITEWEWQHKGPNADNALNAYAFTYDQFGQLTDTKRYEGSSATLTNAFTEQDIDYDRNGNMLAMKRYMSDASIPDEDMEFTVYNGNQLATMVNNGTSYCYEYDPNGNMTTDGYNALKLNYNFLNLTSTVSDTLDNIRAKYSWLADGTKLGVKNSAATSGYEYLGSLVYKRVNSGLQLESTDFGEGRIMVSEGSSGEVYTPYYYITDHLGSTRVIVSHTGELLDRSDYYPYGLKWEHLGAQTSDNRWLFNGKELQTVGLPYDAKILNYGARFYNPRIGCWFGIDQMAEKYYDWSPYAMCKNSPINKVDIDGRDDYFARNGKFLFRDKKSTDFIIIITPNNNYKKGSLESILTGTESNITDTYLSNRAIRNIVGYYNAELDRTDGAMPNIKIETVSSSRKGTLMQVNSWTPNTISVNKNTGGTSKGGKINWLLNTVSNIKNTLVHERKHIEKGHVTDQSMTEEKMELEAIEAQKNHPTWEDTTDEYKKSIEYNENSYKNQ